MTRVRCAPPRESDIEKVVEEGIARTKYVVPKLMPPKMDEDEVEGAKRIAQLIHMQRILKCATTFGRDGAKQSNLQCVG